MVTGVLTVDRAMLLADGTTPVTFVSFHQSTGLYYTVVSRIEGNPLNPLPISDKFKSASGVVVGNCYITSQGTLIIAVLPDQTATTRELATAWFASNPTTFVYELATPTTYQLTPQEVKTLLGTNNLWADTGDTSAEYSADTKLYILKEVS